MIVDEFKSDSTLIRFDDRDIETKENNEDILNNLLGAIYIDQEKGWIKLTKERGYFGKSI